MPYARDESASPPQRPVSLSPEPNNAAGPSKKPRASVNDIQRRQVEKLLANPDKEVQLPTGLKEKTLRAPRDMMKNVQGSSAGAGSGEFHVYKQSRRREYERLRMMETKARAEEEQRAFIARQAERDAVADAKTSKNRAKRQKRKQGRKGNGENSEAGGAGGGGGGGVAKRKLEGGAGIVFKRPGEESSSEDEEDEDVGPALPVQTQQVEEAELPKAAPEAPILIHDDD